MYIFDLSNELLQFLIFSNSLSDKNPVLIFEKLILDFEESILIINCSLVISSEKNPTFNPLVIAAFKTIFNPKEVFPIPGLAAKIIKSDACKPAVILSSLLNPLGTPVIASFLLARFSIIFIVSKASS